MSLAAPDSLLVPPAANARRRLHRRSSCSSIPRSVSACSSVWAFDLSSEDLRVPADSGEVETPVSTTHPDGFDSRAKSPPCDDSCSESLSNYHFDIAGQDHDSSEQPNPPEINPSLERAPAPSQQVPPVIPPAPAFPRPLVLVEAVRPDPPITGTRPLRIDRSKKRQELGGDGGSQRTPRADAPYPIGELARTQQTEWVKPGLFLSLDLLLSDPFPKSPIQVVPVATLFPTGLIPLQHAQDKFRHAHCLDRLPPPALNQSDIANPPTPSSGNRSPRTLGWSFGRAFRKQKA
ncbi:hypothetical protein EDB86DRAFT_3070284 [Lactarius hatsudake]|nr:hypothetical protein EDB86DRAFT_3070284 [Lactarius hatsudake]